MLKVTQLLSWTKSSTQAIFQTKLLTTMLSLLPNTALKQIKGYQKCSQNYLSILLKFEESILTPEDISKPGYY